MLLVIALLSLVVVCLIVMLNHETEESSARTMGAFQSACEIAPVHVENKILFVFALRPQTPYSNTIDGFKIRLIVNDEIIKTHVDKSGTYPEHHNNVMLRYATHQYCHGNRELANLLLKLLNKADPTIRVYFRSEKEEIPTYLPSMSIGEACKLANEDPEKAESMLSHEANQWEWQKAIGLKNIVQTQSAPSD